MGSYIQLTIRSDEDLMNDIDGHFELESDRESARSHGLVFYVLEKISEGGEDDQIEFLDSCGGFIAVPGFEDHMAEQWSTCLPAGVSRADVRIVRA